MLIKKDKCIGCGQCVIVCPVQAISLVENKAVINDEICVECDICYRNAECPVNAIRPRRLKWPRVIRSPFSNVISTHKLTGIPGRGTEEMKTNDVTNRFKMGEIGFSIEIGRPGVGTYLKNVELFTEPLSIIGVQYEENSPVTALLKEDKIHLQDDIKEEYVLSAIIEFKVSEDKVLDVLKMIRDVENKIETVFTVGVVTRIPQDMKDDKIPIIKILEEEGFPVRPNAKVNVGLGKA
ncbi:MAG: 4Fe-4S dicluster domain-containing protein [Candidatus Lokiarchaeota archaeon]|nr:4Fe-4S dicluster domain-containing protein [Candidatus Lokiarchaeota archaeon]MBD3338631.1 4Fe-4S dicluster domain-containing protein [Candidatus Lokiarchaeota archaeon]